MKGLLMSLVCYFSHGKLSFRDAYNVIYRGQNRSNVFSGILKESFGDEFADGVDSFSFVTITDLNNILKYLNLNQGQCFADIGCGRGGPGIWIAERSGAGLVGIDISEEAVKTAAKRVETLNLNIDARFKKGNFYKTGLDNNSVDSVISIDAFWMVTNRKKALREIKRILKPGGRFAFTTWDGNIPFMPDDHRKDLADSGFFVEKYEESSGWKERQFKVYEKVLEKKDSIINEIGKRYAYPLIKEAESAPRALINSRRVLICARKN